MDYLRLVEERFLFKIAPYKATWAVALASGLGQAACYTTILATLTRLESQLERGSLALIT
jgi:hypothetical protein